jgi:two-component system, NtrC family, response regulator AtoC
VPEPWERDTSIEKLSSTSRERRVDGSVGRLCLVIIGEGLEATYPLPDSGAVGIGRSEDADIRIDHRTVSREHALLHIGSTLLIEDLGSSNGTRVRDSRIPPKQSVEVALGEPIDVGSVMIVVQQRAVPVHQRHIWAHGYFEARLEEECARAKRAGSEFVVVRLHCGGTISSRDVEACLSRQLRNMDVVGYYGPAEYEILIVDSNRASATDITSRLVAALHEVGVQARVGIAHYPTDAQDPYSLLSKAGAVALGVGGQAPEGRPVLVANPSMQNLDRIVQRIAAGTISVLITGETGVGKEVLAERVHRLSPRANRPFLRLNCAALSESLLESELFGHERGSFTGAVQAKRGLLETAQGGTVFLDEIGELPMSIQVKLLRVIEERQVLPVGALKPRPIDVRFLAATNRDLELEITRGAFRQDLYFRLNGISLLIPPLRERVSEIADLAGAFLRLASERSQRSPVPPISREAMKLLMAYHWPGNIRELRNVMERALLLCTSGDIRPEHLPTEKMRGPHPDQVASARPAISTAAFATAPPFPAVEPPPDADERQRIMDALTEAGGNQTEAAKLLGISRRTLINRVIQYDIPRPRKKGPLGR